MPPKLDKLGRKARRSSLGQRNRRKTKQSRSATAAADLPTETAASRPSRRLSAVAAMKKLVEQAEDQAAIEALGLQDMLAAAGITSEARAHEAQVYFCAHTLRA